MDGSEIFPRPLGWRRTGRGKPPAILPYLLPGGRRKIPVNAKALSVGEWIGTLLSVCLVIALGAFIEDNLRSDYGQIASIIGITLLVGVGPVLIKHFSGKRNPPSVNLVRHDRAGRFPALPPLSRVWRGVMRNT